MALLGGRRDVIHTHTEEKEKNEEEDATFGFRKDANLWFLCLPAIT